MTMQPLTYIGHCESCHQHTKVLMVRSYDGQQVRWCCEACRPSVIRDGRYWFVVLEEEQENDEKRKDTPQ